MNMPLGGVGSGDFRETSARVQLFYVVTRNSFGTLTTDAFTQANPPVILTDRSTTLANITKVGVLGGSVAFTRPDNVGGNGYIGGPVAPSAVYNDGIKPLGIFLNDAIGNPFENTPGVASGKGPYVCGSGSVVGVSIYETYDLTSHALLQYATGDRLYASANGLLTNQIADAYEYRVGGHGSYPYPTLMGICKAAPGGVNPLLVLDLRV